MTTATLPSDTDRRESQARQLELAWQLGATLNQIDHLQTLAWLCSNRDAAGDALCCWDGLALQAGQLALSIQQQDILCETIRRSRSDLERSFLSDWRADAMFDTAREIEYRISNDNVPDCYIYNEEWTRLLGAPSTLCRNAQSELEAHLTQRQIRILRLAMHADQLVHPVRASLDNWRLPAVGGADTPYDAASSDSLGARCNLRATPLEKHFPVGLRDDRPVPPWSTWWDALRQRWAGCGLPPNNFPFNDHIDSAMAGHCTLEAIHEAATAAIRRSPDLGDYEITLAVGEIALPPSIDRRLNLHFEVEGARDIRRDGIAKVVPVRNLVLNLAKYMADRGEDFTDADTLSALWPTFGGAEGPERGTIDKTINELRTAMTQLGVELENKQGRGWRFVDAANAEL